MPLSVLLPPVMCPEPSSLVTAPGGFWIGTTWYGYKDAAGNFVAEQPSLPAQLAPPDGDALQWESKQRMTPPRKATQWLASLALEGEAVRQPRARELVERWDTVSLSVDRFSLLEATMGEEKALPGKKAPVKKPGKVAKKAAGQRKAAT